jgi:glycosyltransferase involved in cell wall biosynthesis
MADTPPDPHRGAAGTEVQTVAALRRLGHEVDTRWAAHLGRRIGHGNLHLLLELPRAYEREAVRALAKAEYDVIHVNQPHGFRAARAVHRLSPRSVFIHRSHGIELHAAATLAPWRAKLGETDERSHFRRLASRLLEPRLARHSHAIAREADGHIVSSSLDARFLQDVLHIEAARIALIPQAAPDSYLATPAPPMTPARLGRVLHVAQLAFFKAPMITAAAFNQMAAADPTLRFTWVCDRDSHTSIRALLSPDAAQRTELLHWTSQDALRDVYDAHGLFLFPSFFEGFGKAFLEAMSRGLCVVASDSGAMHDVIAGGLNGFLVPPGEAPALAAQALSIRGDFERAVALSTAAGRSAREYTWDRVARETAAFYRARLTARNAMAR